MNQLPAHLQRFQSRDLGTRLSSNLGAASPPYISIAGGRFTAIDAAGNDMPVGAFDQTLGVYIDVCIIDAGDHVSRVYYEKDYDPSATAFSPPDCWSDNGVGPSVSCSHPQAPSCAACNWSVWGSATSAQGKPIPACQQVQKLAVMVPTIPQAVFLLRIPPNSHKNLRSYNELSKRNGADVSNLITRVYFDRSTQGTLLFSAVNWIDESIAQAREVAYQEKKTDGIVGRLDQARQGTVPLAAPQQQQSLLAPVAAAQTGQMTTPQDTPMFQSPSATSTIQNTVAPVGTAAGASPSEAAPARRRRRTSAEAQPNGAAPMQQGQAPQAPFPVQGQPAGQQAAPNNFGMAQPAQPAADVAAQLDSFFGKA